MRICELRQKEVINTCTCRSLGCPIDIEFDCRTSCLSALVLPGPGRFCCLFGRDEYHHPLGMHLPDRRRYHPGKNRRRKVFV